MSLYFTPAMISSLLNMTTHQTKLMSEGPYRFTTRITSDDAGITREVLCYDPAGKMVWNAFTVDGRKLNSLDLRRFCTNRAFNETALVEYPGYNIAVFDPQKLVDSRHVDSVASGGMVGSVSPNRAAMFAGSHHGRMLNGNVPQPGNIMPAARVVFPGSPGYPQFGPSDFPPGPAFGDQPWFHQPHQPTRASNTTFVESGMKSAEETLASTLHPEAIGFYAIFMARLKCKINETTSWTGQAPFDDDLRCHLSFINTGLSLNGYAIIQALTTRKLKKRGYDCVFHGCADDFTVVVSIDI